MSAPILENLQQADYVHVLLNPLPIYGLAMGTVALAIGFSMKSRAAQVLALWLVFVSALSAWPVYLYGQRAYHRVYIMADSDGQVWLDQHRQRAEKTENCRTVGGGCSRTQCRNARGGRFDSLPRRKNSSPGIQSGTGPCQRAKRDKSDS